MVDLVLHPGHSKCGSTTIQNFLYKNKEKFQNRGVFFPDLNFNFPCHEDYQFHLTHTPRDYLAKVQSGEVAIEVLSKKIDDLLAHAEDMGCRRVIVSAENLINGISGGITSSIHQLFSEKFNNVRIVYYVRKQDALMLSAWQQWGHKEGISLDDYVAKLMNTKFADFDFVARHLKRFYPNGSLNVFPIEKAHLVDQCLLSDFCTRAAINKKNLNFDLEPSNEGISSALCDSLTKVHGIYPNQHDQNIKNTLIEFASHSSKILNKKYKVDLSFNIRKELFERFHESNERLAKKFFPNVSFEETMSLLSLKSHSEDELEFLKCRVEKLEDLTAIQMDLILNLIKKGI
ncbi:MAG: hypothetical protein ABJN96_07750 [Marinomonas sp.]